MAVKKNFLRRMIDAVEGVTPAKAKKAVKTKAKKAVKAVKRKAKAAKSAVKKKAKKAKK